MQDAAVKWLVGTYPVPEILLLRSLVIILIAGVIGRRAASRPCCAVAPRARWCCGRR